MQLAKQIKICGLFMFIYLHQTQCVPTELRSSISIETNTVLLFQISTVYIYNSLSSLTLPWNATPHRGAATPLSQPEALGQTHLWCSQMHAYKHTYSNHTHTYKQTYKRTHQPYAHIRQPYAHIHWNHTYKHTYTHISTHPRNLAHTYTHTYRQPYAHMHAWHGKNGREGLVQTFSCCKTVKTEQSEGMRRWKDRE